MLSAEIGVPPIAYTSEIALVAATRPKSYGSSTIGVKKSTVCTSARSSRSAYTPASSAVPKPTKTRSFAVDGNVRSTDASSAEPSLLAQPPHDASAVSRTGTSTSITNPPKMKKTLLLLPGPVPVAQPVLEAMAWPMINHRGPEFAELLARLERGMQPVFGTSNDVVFLGSSGTGAMEAAVASCFSPGDRLLSCPVGVFGKRFAQIARAHGCDVEVLDTPLGAALDPARVARAAATRRCQAAFAAYC